MLEVRVFDLDNHQDEILDYLNSDTRMLVSYKVPYKYDKELGLVVNLEVTTMPVDPMNRWEGSDKATRSIELQYTTNSVNAILSNPATQLIKIHKIPDGTSFCYVVDYLITV